MPEMSHQERARLDSIKRTWQQRLQISDRLSRIKVKLGVYSGKGGVGKTTVAVNLAVALANKGFSVGLLDADIDCPNAAKVIGATESATMDNGQFIPPRAYGVKVISMSFFQKNEEEAIIWRGPMIHNALNQLLENTDWGELDYLVVDLPPGTSDAPLTIMQVLQLDGFVVVTTPQSLAKLDAKRSINMIKKMNVNVLGIVENLSGGVFGSGAGEDLATEMDLAFLGRHQLLAEYMSSKKPTVLESKLVADEYDRLVEAVLPKLPSASQAAG